MEMKMYESFDSFPAFRGVGPRVEWMSKLSQAVKPICLVPPVFVVFAVFTQTAEIVV
jgi:hypothetical protein